MRRVAVVSVVLGALVGAPGALADLPTGRTSYREAADYDAEIAQLAASRPGVARAITLPQRSLENRPVRAIEIAGNVGLADGRPVLVVLALEHGDEWPSGEMAMEWAHELTRAYGADARTTGLLDALRVIVLPVVNPDGFAVSRSAVETAPVMGSFASKRRNCRLEDGRTPTAGACDDREQRNRGVDLDRNFGVFWGAGGSSAEPAAETYRGVTPFSEPESVNVRELVSSRQTVALVSTHAGSGAVLRPPGLQAEGATPDEALLRAIGDAAAAASGLPSLPAWQRAEGAGTVEDWSYFTAGTLGLAVEVAVDGVRPPYEDVIAAYTPTRAAYLVAAQAAADAAGHALLVGRAPENTTLRLRKDVETPTAVTGVPVGRDVFSSALEVGSSGRFQWHVNPSTRPFAMRDRTTIGVAGTPARRVPVASPAPLAPGRPATFGIEVGADARRQLRATISGEPGDDYDLVLYAGAVADANRVASSAGAGADESLVLDDPASGRYILEVRSAGALGGFDGALEVFGSQPGTEIRLPAAEETWELTCERRDGTVLARRKVDLRRGQRKDLGQICRAAETVPSGLNLAVTARQSGVSGSVIRAGLRAQATCSRECELSMVASSGRTVVARSAVTRFSGRRVVRLRVTKAGRSLLRRRRTVDLVVTGFARDRLGSAVVRSIRVTLRR